VGDKNRIRRILNIAQDPSRGNEGLRGKEGRSHAVAVGTQGFQKLEIRVDGFRTSSLGGVGGTEASLIQWEGVWKIQELTLGRRAKRDEDCRATGIRKRLGEPPHGIGGLRGKWRYRRDSGEKPRSFSEGGAKGI